MERSDRQKAASAANGRKGRGPVTSQGKVKSAQNARSHGLTGTTAGLTKKDLAGLERLRQRLADRYDVSNAQNIALVERVLASTLKLAQTRSMMTTTIERLAGLETDAVKREGYHYIQYISNIEALLREMSGQKEIDLRLLSLLAEEAGFEKTAQRELPAQLARLAKYAQRFRGERDSALKKLEKMRSSHEVS